MTPLGKLVIVVLFGWAGVHKFIAGKKVQGLIYLFTFGVGGIGWLLDIVLALLACLGSMTGRKSSNAKVVKAHSFRENNNEDLQTNAIQNTAPSTVLLRKTELKSAAAIRRAGTYVVLDLETTGLSRQKDEVVEIGLMQVKDGQAVDTFTSLVNPGCPIPAAASRVNGIYDADVEDAPKLDALMPRILDELQGKVVVGYNVTFDLGFIRRAASAMQRVMTIEYIDVLYLARDVFPDLPDHKLATVVEYLGLQTQEHRALSDVQLTYQIFEICKERMLERYEAIRQKKKEEKNKADAEREARFADSPLLDKTFAFTGVFQSDRLELEAMVGKVGAVLKNSVSRKLNYLVVGDLSDYDDGTGKLTMAETFIAEGHPIQLITEVEYLRLIRSAIK